MRDLITPTWKINSIYSIQPSDLQAHNIKAIICDLDNTLLAWHEKDHTAELAEWIQKMKEAGIGVYLLSNNNFNRVLKVAEPLDLKFRAMALKPRRKYFQLALSDLQVANSEVAVIGDQILTDIIGANRNNFRSILVKPIATSDIIYTKFNRQLERILLKLIGINRKEDWGDKLD